MSSRRRSLLDPEYLTHTQMLSYRFRKVRWRYIWRIFLAASITAPVLFGVHEAVTATRHARRALLVDHYEAVTGCIVLTCVANNTNYGTRAQALLLSVRKNLTAGDAKVCEEVAGRKCYNVNITLVDGSGIPTNNFTEAVGASAASIFALADHQVIKEVCHYAAERCHHINQARNSCFLTS